MQRHTTEFKSMSLETVDALSWWLGVATVSLTLLAAIAGAFAWYLSAKSSGLKDAKNAKLAKTVLATTQSHADARKEAANALGEARAARPGSQVAISVTATAHIRIKDAVRYDPAKHGGGIVYQALLHFGSAAALAKRPGGHLVYCVSEDIKDWHGSGEAVGKDTSYDLKFRDGGLTEQAKSMTVDEILNQCDTALITPLFLYGKGAKISGGSITLTINATKSKTFTIFPQFQQDVWDWIQANY